MMMNNYYLRLLANGECMLLYQKRDMHVLSKNKNLSCHNHGTLLLSTCMFMHSIMSFHPYHHLCILVSYCVLMHIGSPEGITLLEFEIVEEEDQEAPQQVALEKRRAGPRGITGVPRSQAYILSKRQAPEHTKPHMFL